ncbi:YfiR family protein [Pantoea vagans]|uniref:YfiR family protein n=1 Tax=Pantoea vagans TaxID=470934 RepID=UPI0028ED53FF|nr:YfiR family protein [Pantoea vagans]
MTHKYPLHHDVDVLLLLRRICQTALMLLILLFLHPSIALAGIKDDKANRIVSGIISFTHWQNLNKPPELCVFTSARHLSLPENSGAATATFTVVYLAGADDPALHRCDAIYFGDQTPQQQVDIIEKLKGKAVLTLAENNAECALGAAFCLIFQPDHTHFSVNLDSLARSGIRVNPEVLLLSREGSE